MYIFTQNETGLVKVAASIRNNFKIVCVPEAAESFDGWGFVVVVFVGVFSAIALSATVCSVYAGLQPLASSTMVAWFAMDRSASRLVAAIPGDFNILNGLRFFSMVWVITVRTPLICCLLSFF